MIQFNVTFRTEDERKEREKSVGIGKSSHFPGECEAHLESECEGVGCRVVQQWVLLQLSGV